ncbi:MAG: M23 family metallopeptidase [Bacilli bacterium]|nr:M23 family metallopeptidase [Bacilli bacterium]
MDNLDEIKARFKIKNNISRIRTSNNLTLDKKLFTHLNKILITILLFISTLIFVKASSENKIFIYDNVFSKNFKFAKINGLYKKYLGDIIPFQSIVNNNNMPVFSSKLEYSEASKYIDGVKLKVETDYLIPVKNSGIVVFIGEKENYGNTIIIQQTNGIDMWYGNIKNSSVKMYDYVEEGVLLGEANGKELYLLFQKDGKFLDYKGYLK